MAGYYDYVLALVPLVMCALVALLTTVGWSLLAAAPVGAAAAALVIGHALFVNGPTEPSAGDVDVGPAAD